eukprot:192958_1
MSEYIRKEDFTIEILQKLVNDVVVNRHDIDHYKTVCMMTLDNAIVAIKEKIVTYEEEKETFTNLGILMLCRATVIVRKQLFSEFNRANEYLKELYEMMVVTKTPFARPISFQIIFLLCEAALMNINIRPVVFKKILSLKLLVAVYFNTVSFSDIICFQYLIKKTMKEKKWIKISIQHLNKCFEMMVKYADNADVVKCMKKILVYQAYFRFRQGYNQDESETELSKLIRNVKDNQVRERLIVFLPKMFKKNKGIFTYDQEYEAFEDICIILKSKENRLCIKNTMMGKKCSWCFSKCSKLSTCGKCQKEWYCCRNCQKRQWNRYHRYQCC